MDWRDPNGPFQQSMRAWRLLLLTLVTSLVLAALLPLAVLWYLTGPSLQLSGFSLLLLCLAFVLLAWALIVALRQMLRVSGLLRLVPQHDGRVCPKCVVALLPDEGADRLACPRCGASYAESDLHAQWRRQGIAPMANSRWKNIEKFIENGEIQSAIQIRALRRETVKIVLMMAILWGGFIGFNMMIWSGHFNVLQNALPFTLLGVAAMVAAFGWRAAEVDRRYCTHCRYERVQGAGEHCPECGSQWNETGATTAGRIVPRPAVLAGAGVVLALSLLLILAMFVGANVIARATPTNTIINRMGTTDDIRSMLLYQELASRTLDEQQNRRLIELLLEKRGRDALTIYDGQWLGNQLALGAMPAELLDEFHRGMLELELIAPERVRVGETIDVGIRVIDRFAVLQALHPTAIVCGYFIGDDPTPRERLPVAKPVVLMGDERIVNGVREQHHHAQGPRLSFVAQGPGEVRVRLELWLFAMSRLEDASFIVRWNDDGTPALPERYEWMERMVIERVVEVVEDP